MIDYDYIGKVRSVLSKASSRIMEVYLSDNLNIKLKEDRSPVTRADLASNDIITERLRVLDPGTLIISEESEPEMNISAASGKFWLLDPLDGTKDFIAKNGEFCISLALIQGHTAVEGYIYAPVTNKFWFAVKGEGAYRWSEGKPFRLPLTELSGDFVLLKSRSHHGPPEERWIAEAKKGMKIKTRRHGSAIKFCLIAEGSGDLYLKKRGIHGWDIAAGAVILGESGGGIIDIKNGEEIRFKPDMETVPHFLAYGNRIKEPHELLF